MIETNWWAKGLLFENCNCQLVCPGHFGFRQNCTHERCFGYWGIHFRDGQFGRTALEGLNVVILYDAPQHMSAGGWTELFYIDERADTDQRRALESILSGQAGGPWKVLANFVSTRLDTRFAPILFEDAGRTKRIRIQGYLETDVSAIRGADGSGEAVLSNLFNQIHGPVHVLARGKTQSTNPPFDFAIDGTHALYSEFSWTVR